jgi:hypothetical protein
MNSDTIVTVYVVIDDLLKLMNYADDTRARLSAAEILTVAVISAHQFQNHHERTLGVMSGLGYIGHFSVSRFNRRLHALGEVLMEIVTVLSELLAEGTVYIVDAMPLPTCRWVRRNRSKKVNGRAYEGYCASKKERFFGFQLHLVCDAYGVPVTFDMLPAKWDELVPVQHLLADLPDGSLVVADKGYVSQKDELISAAAGVRLIPKYRKNMRGNSRKDRNLIRQHRSTIETVNSQLEKMGIQRLHARTQLGFGLKVIASLIALIFKRII